MYKVKVNDEADFNIEISQHGLKVNDDEVLIDKRELSSGRSHVIYKDRSYNVEIVSEHNDEKLVEIKVNGRSYMVKTEDQFDQLLKQLGMDNLTAGKVQEIKAPMPGLVLNVLVAEGQEVQKGDNLLILEAMKMENIIKSTTNGTVKKINVSKGDKVEKNTVLIQFS